MAALTINYVRTPLLQYKTDNEVSLQLRPFYYALVATQQLAQVADLVIVAIAQAATNC
jgi:hypothetical protein